MNIICVFSCLTIAFIVPSVTLLRLNVPGFSPLPATSRSQTSLHSRCENELLSIYGRNLPDTRQRTPQHSADSEYDDSHASICKYHNTFILIFILLGLVAIADVFTVSRSIQKHLIESSRIKLLKLIQKLKQQKLYRSNLSATPVSKKKHDDEPAYFKTRRTKKSVKRVTSHDAQTYTEEYVPGLILPTHFYQYRIAQPPPPIEAYIIVRYPDHYNAALPQATINRIDRMSNEEFLQHILNEMNLDEREVLLFDEAQRRRTFTLKWPHSAALDGDRMSANGFYYLGDGDRVQCAFCRGILQTWSPNDDPRTEHSRHFRFCRLVRNLDCGNIVYKPDRDLSVNDLASLKVKRFDVDGPSSMFSSSFNPDELGINLNKPFRPEFAPTQVRKETFKNAPKSVNFSIDDAVKAGFYYTGFDDSVRCFFCNGGLREWSSTDLPEVEHARWFPECPYLIALRGKEWVDTTFDNTPPNRRNNKFAEVKEIEQKVKQRKTNQREVMETYINYLGYGRELTDKVWAEAGPFDTVRPWLEKIYADLDNSPYDKRNKHQPSQVDMKTLRNLARDNPSTSRDHVNRAFNRSPSPDYDGCLIEPERVEDKDGDMACKVPSCPGREAMTSRGYKANYIALPCGHITFCEKCAYASEKGNKPVIARCPRPQCQNQIKAMIRFFTA